MDQAHRFYPLSSLELRAMGNRTTEWDLNKWKWDADLFVASPLESVPYNVGGSGQYIPIPMPGGGNSSNSSSSCSDEANPANETGIWDSERKRRVVVVEDDSGGLGDETGTLTLKLGRHPVSDREFGNLEETNHGKKAKLSGGSANRAVCQVEDCGADLSRAKDYHRRHKVCEMHSKASNALVGNVMQRFCQQCSRFHLLQEFDEGKRSCRRRLAGHNKRRRKTQPETVASGQSVNDEQASNYILISLLRILSGMHANNRGDQATDGELLHHLLRSLAGQCGQSNISGMLQESQKLLSSAMAYGNSDKMSTFNSNGSHRPPRPNDQHVTLPASGVVQKGLQIANPTDREFQAASMQKPDFMLAKESPPSSSEVRYSSAGREKLNNFDLNDVYVDSDDGMEDPERSPPTVTFGPSSWVQQDSQQSSPPQISGNSDSASAQSPSSSSGEAQSRTDRIVFKLFGKEPNDFPSVLRGQILDWLAHSPTDIESYIRPGCIILTIYLRLAESVWEELCSDLTASLARLFNIADDPFWRTGWVCARVQDQVAFVHNGEVVVQTALRHQDDDCSRIIYVTPIAVSMAEQARFQIKGPNLSGPSTRLLCAIDGDYLVQDSDHESITDKDGSKENDEIECINLSFSIPTVSGRGFIEVEDNGLNSSFFPFIVAEKDVCSEIRMLETSLESAKTDGDAPRGNINKEAVLQVMDFIHEMGWLLHRNNLNNRLGNLNPNTELFSFKRFKWVMEFAMDRDWCAVAKKLLDILLGGTVGSGEHPSLKAALLEIGLLHRAVRRSSRPMVELLLKYVPAGASDDICSQHMSASDEGPVDFLFRPDTRGPAGLTPLHIAAGRDGAEDLLDALTSDPRKVGIEAWKNARDSTGFTPEDYARLRGHYSYIHLVQKKLNRRPSTGSSVVLDIPEGLPDGTENRKQNDVVSFEIGKSGGLRSMASKQCGLCHHRLAHGNAVSGQRSLLYRPAMLSMVAIAAVCVCVALLFKSLPQVVYVFQPFRWELLEYGSS